MLGARTIDSKGTGEWQFPLVTPDQTNIGTPLSGEVSGGWSRMRAIQSEHQRHKQERVAVLVTAGKDSGGESESQKAAQELSKRYGLPPNSVISLGGVGTTLGNAQATLDYIRSHADSLGKVQEIELATNDYHMLRAWIMFSKEVGERATDTALEISEEDKRDIKRVLDEGMSANPVENLKQVREQVMAILRPYFATSPIRIIPLVVEEVLEKNTVPEPAKVRYARMLRGNQMVTRTIEFEYRGIKDFLDGTYRTK